MKGTLVSRRLVGIVSGLILLNLGLISGVSFAAEKSVSYAAVCKSQGYSEAYSVGGGDAYSYRCRDKKRSNINLDIAGYCRAAFGSKFKKAIPRGTSWVCSDQ